MRENNVIIFSLVYLWNDIDKIKGVIYLSQESLDFIAEGFEKTHLKLNIPLNQIRQIDYYKLYNITISGLIINTLDDKINIFILNEAQDLKQKIFDFKRHLL